MLPTDPSDSLLLGLRASGLIRSGDRVLVAVSGGPDSTALLVAAFELGHHVVAAHYDHALRPGSELAAEHVAALCAKLGVEVVIERRRSSVPRGSVQAGARALRYDFLERARIETGAHVVAMAHTADDLVEGAVLHLMRGCGLAGLRGMPASRGAFVRPLLGVWRHEVLAFLEQREIAALDDPANVDTAYARVRVRREILPALERDRPGIGRRFYAAALRAAAMHAPIEEAAVHALSAGALTGSEVARTTEPLAAELMRQLYARAGGAQPSLSRAHLESMLKLARPGRGGRGVDLPGGLRLRIVGDIMEIVASGAGASSRGRASVRLDVAPCMGCDNRETTHLKSDLDVRLGFRRPGLTMRPVGGRGTRKLQDIFVDARVPREERDTWPLVFAGDRLAWVPGVAVDADHASAPGQPGLHVAVIPDPMRLKPKSPVLKSPNSPPGDPI
ncbi:MAG TPA: tRNA lysidine(34) synthetase TilS [Candidatus Dormibacteraeota bacterium]|nr:tRNA lysidine(34) synthetase TilS [Candidatus Dormibacteraeota bacterium]